MPRSAGCTRGINLGSSNEINFDVKTSKEFDGKCFYMYSVNYWKKLPPDIQCIETKTEFLKFKVIIQLTKKIVYCEYLSKRISLIYY